MDDMYFDPGLRPHSPWDYRTLPSSFWDPFYMDEFSHVGSEMLGGSTYLPPEQERQPYVDGIRVLVKYVGVIGISEPKNPTAVTHAITRVRSEQKATGSRKVLMNLIISARGLQMIDKASGTLRDTFPLEKVSYACVFTNDRKVFAFVSTNDSVSPAVHKCYVLKSKNQAMTAKALELIGRCFTLATEMRRQSVSAPMMEQLSFDRISKQLQERVQKYRLSGPDQAFVTAALAQMQRLYNAARSGASGHVSPGSAEYAPVHGADDAATQGLV
eukprot:m.89480 g.89480  ORF g.89480 m.89480 type:complete len:272 (-) comp8415_c0_seq3:134-949(-)